MTYATRHFASFEDYLAAEPSDLPEGRCEYWDGELVEVMTESLKNDEIANSFLFISTEIGISFSLIRPHSCEVEVVGKPKNRFPDLTILSEAHLSLLEKRMTITLKMPPPQLVAEVVSPGDEDSGNYIWDYQDKPKQYAEIGIPEYWIIDPDRDWVMVGTLIDGAYQFQTFKDDTAIVSPTFPELRLTAATVLGG